MKSFLERVSKTLPGVIIGAIVWVCGSGALLAQSPAKKAEPVLEGLDPVMLVQGKEVQGDLNIAATRGNFQYLFASAENKVLFEKDPARYEIQLDGACARMGQPVTGNPDLYSLHKGRIYIFGSGECKKRFDAAPENYLEAEGEAKLKTASTPDALRKGAALLEKAVQGMGGAARIDGLVSYQEKRTSRESRRNADVEVKTALTIVFPGRIRRDETKPEWRDPSVMGYEGIVVLPGDAFVITPHGALPLPFAYRSQQEKEIARRPLSLLRARNRIGFKSAAAGSGKIGETAVEQVEVAADSESYTLGIDPGTGRVLSLSYRRRGPQGNFGQFVQVFSDFRVVDGLTMPFTITATFNAQPWKEQSSTLESITINGKIDPSLFERPKQNKD